ncbi:MAG TPA: hypothetical protein VFV60_05400 [bacterium]|nr:hypothetical protein [bacterium]
MFARHERREPLRHVGTVTAPEPDLAHVYARTMYDEENWVDMVIIPRTAVIPITPR